MQAVLDEAVAVLRAGHGVLICETRHGLVCANAGVDRSNAGAPASWCCCRRTPTRSARARCAPASPSGAACGPAVVITDSFGRAWRLGQTDVAIGAAGLVALDDWRGPSRRRRPRAARHRDRGGRRGGRRPPTWRAPRTPREPAVLVRGLERFVTDEDGPGAAALRRPPEEDLFR